MAIAPSKLGDLIAAHLDDGDEAFVTLLRDADVVQPSTAHEELVAVRRRAIDEHRSLDAAQQTSNSPHERIRVFLGPYLNDKGRAWAVPLASLYLPDA